MAHVRGAPCHPKTQGKIERWHQTLKNRILLENYYLPGDLEAQNRPLRRAQQSQPLPREPTEPDAGRRLLRQRPDHPAPTRKDQARHHQTEKIATPPESRLNSNPTSQSLRSNTAQVLQKHSKTDRGHQWSSCCLRQEVGQLSH